MSSKSRSCKRESLSLASVMLINIGWFLSLGAIQGCLCLGGNYSSSDGCMEIERNALLDIKKDIYVPNGSSWLSNWTKGGGDCCTWEGVGCDITTRHVVKLDLNYLITGDPRLKGYSLGPSKVNPSMLRLMHLRYLDLSLNNFSGSPIPEFIGSLVNLEYLDLSSTGFNGIVPHQLGNLSKLQFLGLGACLGVDQTSLYVDDLQWLSRLTSLQTLALISIDLSEATDWLHDINLIPSLSELILTSTRLSTIPLFPSHNYNNLTSLTLLDLSQNAFLLTSIPTWILNCSNLVGLDCSACGLDSDIAKVMTTLSHMDLEFLVLSENNFTGPFPNILGNFSHLKQLSLVDNKIEGEIPETIGNLLQLEVLDLSSNQISGQIPCNIGNLSHLKVLYLGSNQISGQIPHTIGMLSNLAYMSLSSNPFRSVLMEAHFANLKSLNSLDLSDCQFRGLLPRSMEKIQFSFLDISSNSFDGPIPNLNSSELQYINLSNNSLSGPIPLSFAVSVNIQYLILSHNLLSSSVPMFFCNLTSLIILDLSNNSLQGSLPQCQMTKPSQLKVVDLSYNKLSGTIPNFLGSPKYLQSVHLGNNVFSGKIPWFLKFCKELVTLDLGENRLFGNIPIWIGQSLPSLKVLRLRSNFFGGNIPVQLSSLKSLQVLDLANNSLLGNLSLSSESFSAMRKIQNVDEDRGKFLYDSYNYYQESVQITAKGIHMVEYASVLSILTSIDLSGNKLSGEIPVELTELVGLVFLNLSGNHFTGKIPQNIGDLRQLQSLDLSINCLFGSIPSSMSELNFLERLNLSHNDLSGSIPSGNQLQTFIDPSIYNYNLNLCGSPLPPCASDTPSNSSQNHTSVQKEEENKDKLQMVWHSFSVALGFIFGFWAFVGTLIIKRSIRYAYFHSIDKICGWIYVKLALNFAKVNAIVLKRNEERLY